MIVTSKGCAFYAVLLVLTIRAATTLTTAIYPAATNAGKPVPNLAEIEEINAKVILFDRKILQLQVRWKDALPNDTSYNVIVSPLNLTECPELPCSLYGISKPSKELVMPEHPMSYVEDLECSYMFGCNYTLTVETSTAAVARNQRISIPYCIMDVCSCKHAPTLPKVQTAVSIPNNETINFNWSIKLNNAKPTQITDVLSSMKLSKIYIKISEQTNPSLSWGGKHIPIAENVYAIGNMSYIRTQGTLQGNVKINVRRQLSAKAVLNLQAYVIDELRCAGPTNMMKIQVPAFNEPQEALVEEGFNVRIALITVTALLACGIVAALMFCMCRGRGRQQKTHADLDKDEQYLSPFATFVDRMEDNINYVDKYVEEAQAKGLADVFEVPHYSLQMGPEIGEGAFGRVYKATALNLRRMRGASVVAVKQLKKNPSADEISEFLGEIEMLKGVGTHNNVVCFLGCCTIRAPYLMIMEFLGRGDLLSYLRNVRHETEKIKTFDANQHVSPKKPTVEEEQPVAKLTAVKYIEMKISTQSADSVDSECGEQQRQPKPSIAETSYTIIDGDEEYNEPFEYILDNKELHNFALQIANGMRFLEEQEITHRDLAARNVLIDERKTLKISDFGLSRHGIYSNTKTRKLPLRWLSIEAIRDNVYSSKSDVWAYGVVLWEIGTLGASPYPTISNHELIPHLIAGKRLEKPEICTEQVYNIMLQCWDETPDVRPSFEQLYKMLSPKTTYVDLSSLSDDYVFPPIKDKDNNTNN